MKKIIYIFICTAVIFGCTSDFLEEQPDNRLELDSISKVSQLVTSAYPEYSYSFTEWMTDNVDFIANTRKTFEDEIYTWQEFIPSITQDTPEGYWNNAYEAIAHANEALDAIEKVPGSEGEKAPVRGEALIARAYAHFMLVNLFAKHYDAATASSDLGIPYIVAPERELIVNYTRNTVQEVYDLIEKDLLEGIPLIDDNTYVGSTKYHFNSKAVLAFASRFYLYKGNWQECIRYSELMLEGSPLTYIRNFDEIDETSSDFDSFARLFSDVNEPYNLLDIITLSTFHRSGRGYIMLRTSTIDLLRSNFPTGDSDARAFPAYFFDSERLSVRSPRYLEIFERTGGAGSNTGFAHAMHVVFQGEEVVLNLIEAYAQNGQLQQSLDLLNIYNTMRYEDAETMDINDVRSYIEGINGTTYSDDTQAMVFYLLRERKKEFMRMGLRIFDIKRYQIPVVHELADGSEITLVGNDPRQVLQIPETAINFGVEKNPR